MLETLACLKKELTLHAVVHGCRSRVVPAGRPTLGSNPPRSCSGLSGNKTNDNSHHGGTSQPTHLPSKTKDTSLSATHSGYHTHSSSCQIFSWYFARFLKTSSILCWPPSILCHASWPPESIVLVLCFLSLPRFPLFAMKVAQKST